MNKENPFVPKATTPSDIKEVVGEQLDAFAEKYGIKSLQDRLRIGLNEVGILAYNETNSLVKDVVKKLGATPEESKRIYNELVALCVGIQQTGPWGYAAELAKPESPEMKAWFMLVGAETIGYERERDLNDAEFSKDIERIKSQLTQAKNDPEEYFAHAQNQLLEQAAKNIRFEKDDTEKSVPIGEGFASFLPMAISGYEAGVVQDAEGWVYVGARQEIDDARIESIGLEKLVAPDERDPERMVTYFVNSEGQKVIKKVHPGLLVILTRSFDLASSIVRATNEKREAIEIAEDALGHTRIIQTTEAVREKLGMQEDRLPEGFLRRSKGPVKKELSSSLALSRPRVEFYNQLHFIRANYVFMDALRQLEKKRQSQGKTVSELDRELLRKKTSEKMAQKVDELEHVSKLMAENFDTLPDNIHTVVDMAGGAGDLGLAVTTELLSRGKDIAHTEIVDPQEGVSEFMKTIIDYLPFREDLEKIVVHNTGKLQAAHITPDAMVVAKHACGTLTDDIISQWRESKSGMLVAMTCCQGKAASEPSRYGFSQNEWENLCHSSDLTNTEIPEQPGKARDRALRRLEEGNRAMKKIDMARVEYLRRHGFAAELSTTDKFPKGDVIMARRLPKNFMKRLQSLQELEEKEPLVFDAMMLKIDMMSIGREVKGLDKASFGDDWTEKDFQEISRRFIAPAFEEFSPVEASDEKVSAPNAGQENSEAKEQQKKRLKEVFYDTSGRIDLYINKRVSESGKSFEASSTGKLVKMIKNIAFRDLDQPSPDARKAVDAIMTEMGY